MQTYQRPLHPLNVNQSSYSSLAGAVHGAVLPPRSATLPPKPPTGRKVIETEIRSSRPKGTPSPFTTTATIPFRRSQPSSLVREGITFKEILDGRRGVLVGAEDIVFPGWAQLTITLQFDVRGYLIRTSFMGLTGSTVARVQSHRAKTNDQVNARPPARHQV